MGLTAKSLKQRAQSDFAPFFFALSRPEIGCHLNNLKDGKANRAQKET